MAEEKRRVIFWEYARNNKEDDVKWIRGDEQHGVFHQFGVDFSVIDTNPAHYSTAIIECENGQLKNVPVEDVKFVDRTERNSKLTDTVDLDSV